VQQETFLYTGGYIVHGMNIHLNNFGLTNINNILIRQSQVIIANYLLKN